MARAQIEALRHRVPFLYGIITINVIALSYTHFSANPFWQVGVLPGGFVVLVMSRTIAWVRMCPDRMTDRELQTVQLTTAGLGALNGMLILLWALTLQQSPPLPDDPGAITGAGHSVVFVSITLVTCIFLLMHHRGAAVTVGVAVMVPLACYLFANHRMIETAIGLNVLLVGGAMMFVAVSFSRNFDGSVVAAADLLRLSASNALLAASDVLTSLPNRRQFFSELAVAAGGVEPFAVIVCDLDGFKQVNDIYGHGAGDELLRQIAARFVATAPAGSCVARMGGDEFTCLLVGPQSRAAREIVERLIASCREPIILDAITAQVGATAGVCFSSSVLSGDAALAYERADYALLEAKRSGRGRVELFSDAHDDALRRKSTIARLLRATSLRHELIPVFQPIVDAHTYEILAFEALIRWSSPELGLVGPQEFIPVAESTDLIFEISRLILRAALARAATWPERILLKVNLSVRDLTSSLQVNHLLSDLRRSGVTPGRVTFEITETILAESLEQVRSSVDRIHAAGCRIAIDDFGVGYSSLNYIHMLAPDVIKIDRCFISKIVENDMTRRVVRTMIELAHNVGAVSVAEGVETAAQVRILTELGCDELQGYYFSRPVCAETSLAMVRRDLNSATTLSEGAIPVV